MTEKTAYSFKYGELYIIAKQLAEQVKEDHMRRVKDYGSTPYFDVMTYDKAKRLLALIEDQESRT